MGMLRLNEKIFIKPDESSLKLREVETIAIDCTKEKQFLVKIKNEKEIENFIFAMPYEGLINELEITSDKFSGVQAE